MNIDAMAIAEYIKHLTDPVKAAVLRQLLDCHYMASKPRKRPEPSIALLPEVMR